MEYSTVPSDLAIVSEYAREQLVETVSAPPPTQAQVQGSIKNEDAIDIKMEELEDEESHVQIEKVEEEPQIKIENVQEEPQVKIENVQEEPQVKTENVQEDAIDAALAGETVDYDSSDVTLSSSSEDESSSSSDEEEEEEEEVKSRMTVPSEDEDEETEVVKTAHEIVDFTVEKPSFEMTPQTAIVLAGEVFQVVGNVVVVQSRAGSEFTTLDQDSLLVYENREVMGEVFETFGPIARPFYTVRFKSSSDIDPELCHIGSPIYYVPDYQKTQFVQTETLRKLKGTDASNMYDEEPDEDEIEFSDDEKELEAKRRKNRERKMKKNVPAGRAGVYMSRDGEIEMNEYNSLVGTIPPRQQQSYADIFDNDFESSLDAYQQSRPQQSYADIDFGASLDSYQQQQQQQQSPTQEQQQHLPMQEQQHPTQEQQQQQMQQALEHQQRLKQQQLLQQQLHDQQQRAAAAQVAASLLSGIPTLSHQETTPAVQTAPSVPAILAVESSTPEPAATQLTATAQEEPAATQLTATAQEEPAATETVQTPPKPVKKSRFGTLPSYEELTKGV